MPHAVTVVLTLSEAGATRLHAYHEKHPLRTIWLEFGTETAPARIKAVTALPDEPTYPPAELVGTEKVELHPTGQATVTESSRTGAGMCWHYYEHSGVESHRCRAASAPGDHFCSEHSTARDVNG